MSDGLKLKFIKKLEWSNCVILWKLSLSAAWSLHDFLPRGREMDISNECRLSAQQEYIKIFEVAPPSDEKTKLKFKLGEIKFW